MQVVRDLVKIELPAMRHGHNLTSSDKDHTTSPTAQGSQLLHSTIARERWDGSLGTQRIGPVTAHQPRLEILTGTNTRLFGPGRRAPVILHPQVSVSSTAGQLSWPAGGIRTLGESRGFLLVCPGHITKDAWASMGTATMG